MNINKKLVKYNFVKGRNGQKIKYIVIHDTGNIGNGSNADNHFIYFNGGNRKASAHYFVDDMQILQIIDDSNTAWHVGDGKGLKGVTNSNSIGIEICVNNDGNYNVAVQKTIELVKYLMDIYGITVYNVVRHYDASGKICPKSMYYNNWAKWNEFKKQLEEVETVKDDRIKIEINGKLHLMEGVFQNDKNYVGVRDLAEALGGQVGWSQETKTVVIKK